MNRAEVYQACVRFGQGASAKDSRAIGDDPRGWLTQQLRPRKAVAAVPAQPSAQVLRANLGAFMRRRELQREAAGRDEAVAEVELEQQAYRRQARRTVLTQVADRFDHAVTTHQPFFERLVHFYSNHFTVSQQGKPQLIGACLGYENEAIRTALGGHFADMLVNVVSHPVMLVYLDNAQSAGPNSRAGRRRNLGLNENLAREILELHTLGVAGGYDQDDVRGLAKIITGWTVGNQRTQRFGGEPGKFVFVDLMHEPGKHRLLGKAYAEDGVRQGRDALHDLARHPATAEHLATKLARHFIADQPPAAAVAALKQTYLDSDGHLPTLHKKLVTLPAAWQADHRKLKNPHDLLVSAVRGLDLPSSGVVARRGVVEGLRTMNHVPFTAPSPAGWPDLVDHWGSPNALRQRVEWGVAAGARTGATSESVGRALQHLLPASAEDVALAARRAESPAQAMGLLLASPDFQWR